MLEGIVRESMEKKATKALRKDGFLIANIYGKGIENINAAFKLNEFVRAIKNKTTFAFPVKVGGTEYKVIIQEYQNEPVNSTILHVDLRVVLDGVISRYLVPVKTTGSPVGVKNKGILINSKSRLSVKCAGENLPNNFTLDVSNLDVGDTILVRDIKVPKNVTILDEDRIAVVGVIKAK